MTSGQQTGQEEEGGEEPEGRQRVETTSDGMKSAMGSDVRPVDDAMLHEVQYEVSVVDEMQRLAIRACVGTGKREEGVQRAELTGE